MDEDDLAAELRALREAVESLESRVDTLEDAVELPDNTGNTATDATESGQPADATGTAPATDAGSADAQVVDRSRADAEAADRSRADTEAADRSRADTEAADRSRADDRGRVEDRGKAEDADEEALTLGDSGFAIGDSEFAIGVKWLGVAGALALIVATAFFVQLAIERGYLGPLERVLLGTAVGVAMLAVGRRVTRRPGLARWGQIVAGTGFVIAYFALYASYAFESYRTAIGHPRWLAIVAMTALVAGTVLVSVIDRDAAIAGEALLFGYVTAGLAIGEFAPLVVPVYVLGLTATLAAIAAVRPWRHVLAAGTAAAYAVLAWWLAAPGESSLALEVPAVLALFVVVVAGTELVRRWDPPLAVDRTPATRATAAVAAINGLAPALFLWYLVGDEGGVGTAVLGGVAVALLGAYLVATEHRDRAADAEPFVAFLAFGVALTFSVETAVRIGLLAVAAVGAVAATRWLGDRRLAEAGVVAGGVLFVDALLAIFGVGGPPAIASTILQAAVATTLAAVYYALFALGSGRFGLAAPDALPGRGRVGAVAGWAGAAMVVVLAAVLFDGVGLSVAWAVVGLASVGVGLTQDVADVRYHGMAVLATATGKVFLFDTASLDPVARILSFLALGVVLLVASFVYARTQADLDLPVVGRAGNRE